MSLPQKPLNKTAQRILAAADELFCERGYDAVSMQDVAARAQVKKAAVFYHFQSKTGLFERILQGYYDAHLRLLQDVARVEGPARERLHNVLDVYIDFMAAHQRYPRLVQQQLAAGAGQREVIQRSLAPLLAFTEEILRGLLPDDGPRAARHLHLSISALVTQFHLYEPVLGSLWGVDPASEAIRAERRQHIHWMVDLILDDLTKENPAAEVR